jgi:hypothetical protein
MPGHRSDQGIQLVAFRSNDNGKTWQPCGIIASDPDARTDIGDGNIVQTANGQLLAVYRHNHHGLERTVPDYAIKVSVSKDNGKTWSPHSVVAESKPAERNPSRGLWSPFLFVTSKGEIQCYYDDEDTPFKNGFPGHQWITMKALTSSSRSWRRATTVARAMDSRHLSRDGMSSVIEVRGGKLLCAFESVQVQPPFAGLIRFVTSSDEGRTWSWQATDRPVLYEPKDRRYHAFSPCLLKLSENEIMATFATNEDRPEPGISGTVPQSLGLDIKYVSSTDGGKTWLKQASEVYYGSHRNYLPGLVRLSKDRILATFIDFNEGCKGRQARVFQKTISRVIGKK